MPLAPIGLTASVHSVGAFHGLWHEGGEALGLALIVVAIVGRAWRSLYIGFFQRAVEAKQSAVVWTSGKRPTFCQPDDLAPKPA